MSKLNHLEICKLLPKSNCRKCGLLTCLAFAASVMNGEKRLGDCPYLESQVIEQFEGTPHKRLSSVENDWEHALNQLRKQVETIDFSSSAERLGAAFSGDRLAIKCLSKHFFVDTKGNVASDCHTTRWLVAPLLSYIIHCEGNAVTGKWIPLRELRNGVHWSRLFGQRCEKPLKQVMDNYTDLFEYIIDIFDGIPAPGSFSSDIAVVIYPLPKLPILICYWKKEGNSDSALSLFFDSTAEDNLNIESIYTLGVGLVTMFERIALTHGKTSSHSAVR